MLPTTPSPICICLALIGLAAGAVGTPDGEAFAVRAARVHVGDGSVIENGIVLVQDGRIQEVGKGIAVPRSSVLIEHDGDLTAGLVALRDRSGLGSEGLDTTRKVMAEADLSFAFDADHSDMQRLLSEGVTSVVLVPHSGTLVGGLCAVVKPAKRVLQRRSQLVLDLGSSALSPNRRPTSYAGALDELERRFDDPQGPFARVARGELGVLIGASTRAEAQRAIQFAGRHRLSGVLMGTPRIGELAAQVKTAGLGVVIEPFRPGTERRSLVSAAKLAEAGVKFGFALDAPSTHPANLRLTAAACVREGLDAGVALRALTSDAASLAGVADRVGSLRAGLDADLVLWSGHPVDPGSRVVAVFVDGEKVHGGDL